MGTWALLVGARLDLPLRHKWWHWLARGFAVLSIPLVGAIAAGRVKDVSAHLTVDNTNSLTLLSYALAHPGTTTLRNFRTLAGTLGQLDADGAVVALRVPDDNAVRCEAPARYKPGESFASDGNTYRPIADRPGQPAGDVRVCAATGAYQSLTAEEIAVFEPTERAYRQQEVRRSTTGVIAALVWFLIYWNVYYRALVPIYARRRERRRAVDPRPWPIR